MVIFHSYVKLPEGNHQQKTRNIGKQTLGEHSFLVNGFYTLGAKATFIFHNP
jgi:hypothetical protein